MNKRLIIFILLCLIARAELFTQPLVVDTTFKPFFKANDILGDPSSINQIWENPESGKLFMTGRFDFLHQGKPYDGFLSCLRNGEVNPSFPGRNGAGIGKSGIIRVNDSIIVLTDDAIYLPLDTTGRVVWGDWFGNYKKTVSCARGVLPFFFENGSSLMVNSLGNPGSCRIINPPDTFDHRYIIKVDSLGYWDSTFRPDANGPPQGFLPYDSTRIWVFGNPRDFTHYNGVQVDGLCRIYHDGSLDTTFKSPLEPMSSTSSIPVLKEEDGGFFLIGGFVLKGDTEISRLVRFNSDGSIDSSFVMNAMEDTAGAGIKGINSMAPTPDGGYLLAGIFDKYQGVPTNGLAKVDSMGNIEPQYFTSRGPDSTTVRNGSDLLAGVSYILPSKFGGYYMVGNWRYWDGKPSQPIVRLIDAKLVGIGEQQIKEPKIDIYPNPVKEQLHISIEQDEWIQHIQLFDLMGKYRNVNTEQSGRNITLDLNLIAKGLYVLIIELNDGRRISKKVIKQ